MKLKAYIMFGIFLLGVSGCAVTDFDRSADFTKYKTYAWGDGDIEVHTPLYDSDFIHKRVRTVVEEELAKRGIVKNQRNPDFLVEYKTYTEEKERTSYNHPYSYRYMPFGFYPFAFGWGVYPYSWMAPQRTEYTEGTLIVDIIDRRSDELVWRGAVSGDVDNVSRLRKQIEKGVKAIMKKYPVSPDEPLNVGGEGNIIS